MVTHMLRLSRRVCMIVISVIALMGSARISAQNILLRFVPMVQQRPLVLDSLMYQNHFAQLYSVTRFRWYCTDVRILGESTQERIADVILCDAEDSASLRVSATVSVSQGYSGVSFVIGVDSLRNCTGAQEGALDPINGMFWSWNSGYIFVKLEGYAPASSAQGKKLEYHIGGYRPPAICMRSVTLPFRMISVADHSTVQIDIGVDVAQILMQPHNINFQERPVVTDFRYAQEMADNYKDMFRILAIKHIPLSR
jgi:hypothetical protein